MAIRPPDWPRCGVFKISKEGEIRRIGTVRHTKRGRMMAVLPPSTVLKHGEKLVVRYLLIQPA